MRGTGNMVGLMARDMNGISIQTSSMRVILTMASFMVLVKSISVMKDNMKDNGSTIRCMARGL